ncbi:hypothetical protein JDV02_003159 [Purpureocillium takamizusanense]|uniref:Exonuclease domain-containing protein n=1 Tax=Purpureocillium takamizusanense TaxID=2060973 RepID=A0A9Q8QCM7_9HYPO|nr:uncharacterized protein JDV02_003159 [Purpureocillium takamizusanense]UNI16751.1 hypothetical protein JDV02_003159 [Purpureocillium takamizusanense]
MLSLDDTWMPPPITNNTNEFKFVNCVEPGCASTSAFSEYGAMTLRAGYNTCTMHTTQDTIKSRVENIVVSPNTTFIFYALEVTNTNEIDQLSAITSTGDHIDLVVKTTTRKNNSPIIGKFPPLVYMIMATEPATAMRAFIEWVRNIHRRSSRGNGTESDVVLVAHNGMNHDHVLLLKTMLVWGINPPKWKFADSLPIFKLVTAPGETASLDVLANEYAPWFQHIHHDGLSDATAIMHVVTKSVPNWQMACLAFSTPCDDYTTSVGLNTLRARSPLPFPD